MPRSYEETVSETSSGSWLGAITNMVGSMFVQEDLAVRNEKMRSHNPALLALYETIHLNRNFITTLAHYQTEATHQGTAGGGAEENGEGEETNTAPQQPAEGG